MDKVTFYVTRHGETLYNTMNRVQGWSDTPLTFKGIEIAKLIGNGLKYVDFAAAYSSDSGRAVETAEIILNESGNKQLKLYRDKRLREWGFGSLEGQSNKDLVKLILKGIPGIAMEEFNYNLPLISSIIVHSDTTGWAEDFCAIKTRLKSVFQNIADKISENGGGNVLIVTHAFTIKTLILIFGENRLNEVKNIENGSITKIIYENGEFEITDINDVQYIQ